MVRPAAQLLMHCRVGVALYSPSYFTREWCGKEFQVLKPSNPGEGGTGIVPVRWTRKVSNPPDCAMEIQDHDASFPRVCSLGMHQLMRLKAAYPDKYELSLLTLADRIVEEARAERLRSLEDLDFERIPSAWEVSAANDPQSHTRGNISKTCFVFVAGRGWDWIPYNDNRMPAQIGALAQKISGELGLRYDEISCNAALRRSYRKPVTIKSPPFYSVIRRSSNGRARKSDAAVRQAIFTELRLTDHLGTWRQGQYRSRSPLDHLKTEVFQQKIESPPPYHEWRSIFSRDDLDQKIRTAIEQIRLRLLKQLVSVPAPGGQPRKAEDLIIAKSAAALGIDTGSVSHLEGPTQ